jgi:hypothetical protein
MADDLLQVDHKENPGGSAGGGLASLGAVAASPPPAVAAANDDVPAAAAPMADFDPLASTTKAPAPPTPSRAHNAEALHLADLYGGGGSGGAAAAIAAAAPAPAPAAAAAIAPQELSEADMLAELAAMGSTGRVQPRQRLQHHNDEDAPEAAYLARRSRARGTDILETTYRTPLGHTVLTCCTRAAALTPHTRNPQPPPARRLR